MIRILINYITGLFRQPPDLLPPPDRSVKRETQLADELIRASYRNRRQA